METVKIKKGAFLVLSLPYKQQRLSSKATKLPTALLPSLGCVVEPWFQALSHPASWLGLHLPPSSPPPPPPSLGGIPHFNLGRDGISATLPRLSVKQ
jgi:hypothetical protein